MQVKETRAKATLNSAEIGMLDPIERLVFTAH
jgi:hypothetical protein